jgi:2-hydroxychromene-2-carboxylate isomerase
MSTCCRPKKLLRVYLDVASPWSAVAFKALPRLERLARVEVVPILLGALFHAIGTLGTPAARMSAPQLAWSQRDLALWDEWWTRGTALPLRFPDTFPLRTVTVQRVLLVEPSTLACLFDAAWRHNSNISELDVLRSVLDDYGFNGSELIERASQPAIKQQLKDNTALAVQKGMCGVPTFEVDGHIVFGQDRMGVVEDLLCGWQPQPNSKL